MLKPSSPLTPGAGGVPGFAGGAGLESTSSEMNLKLELIHLLMRIRIYRVTIQLVTKLLLTSKQNFSFGLARPGEARPKQNFYFEVSGRFVTS